LESAKQELNKTTCHSGIEPESSLLPEAFVMKGAAADVSEGITHREIASAVIPTVIPATVPSAAHQARNDLKNAFCPLPSLVQTGLCLKKYSINLFHIYKCQFFRYAVFITRLKLPPKTNCLQEICRKFE